MAAGVLSSAALNDTDRPTLHRTGRAHLLAVAQALVVTFLWSTSWVLIKIGLDDLDLQPISFAGLRYALAAAILLPFGAQALRARRHGPPPDARLLAVVALYGVLFIAVAQGAQFAALAVLPATGVNLLLASIPVAVGLVALARGEERPSVGQAAGIILLLLGAWLYFGPLQIGAVAGVGLLAAGVCVVASAASAHLGRDLARDAIGRLGGPIGLTAISMAVGGSLLLSVGLLVEGLPSLDLRSLAIIGWLGVVNTAIAFSLWNHTLRMLTAVESSVMANTMIVQIAVLAVIFLGERLTPGQVAGLALASSGALVVQVAPRVLAARRGPPPAADQLGESMR
jgi:drug/metabolite transporter (DMT)-like permease